MSAYDQFLARVQIALSVVLAVGFLPQRDIAQCLPDQRPVTVADSIEMTEIVPPPKQPGSESDDAALLSPDRSRFAVLVKKGNLQTNTNEYTLLVYVTRDAFRSRQAEARLRMSSNTNQPAISQLHWLKDNRTLLFLGEQTGESAQIYSFSATEKRLRRLTNHSTSIASFSASDDGGTIVFEAEPSPRPLVRTRETLRNGFIVQGEELISILSSGYGSIQSMDFVSRDLFVVSGSHAPRRIALKDGIWPYLALSVSPNGRYALVEANAREIPEDWKRYGSGILQIYLTARKDPAAMSLVETYSLLDTQSGEVTSLLGTPKDWGEDGFLWLDGGRSLIVSHSFLPLAGAGSPEEQHAREQRPSVVEVQLPSKKAVQIDLTGLTVSSWDAKKKQLTLLDSGGNTHVRRVYSRQDSHWVLASTDDAPAQNTYSRVSVVQGMETPPSLWLSDPSSGRKVMLLDPNPQFSRLCFAKEKEFDWKATDGHSVQGGLYFPPGYMAGRRYPLVIQTHAFHPDKFWIDGPWHSAYAAQALAAKGIVVLQMGYDQIGRGTPEEAPRAMAAFDGAIDALSTNGIIDPNRVGILGFSRTFFHAAYALTHSRHHFAAATLADGVDGSYFQAIAFGIEAPDAIAVNGGPPWGQTLRGWLERSPLFGVASVASPVRLEAYGMDSVLGLWGWHALLARKGMPVDMIVLPDAPHLLVKPWERAVSQQGTVDWFSFWLEGEEDPVPEKAGQYARWRKLRSLFENISSQPRSPGGDH